MDRFWDDLSAAFSHVLNDIAQLAANVVEAAIITLIAVVLARILRTRVLRAIQQVPRVDPNLAMLAANATMVVVYVIAGMLILSLLGGNWTAIVATLGASTVAISLALQDVLRSFVAGVYLLLERPFAIGDRIKVKDVEGEVEAIELRITMLRTEGRGMVYVPNATVFSEIVTNRSVDHVARAIVTLGGLSHDLGAIQEEIGAALAGAPGLYGSPRLEEVTSDESGLTTKFSVAHDPGRDVTATLAARLHQQFPEATVAVNRSGA